MNGTVKTITPWRLQLRDNRLVIAFEFAAIAAVFVADAHHLIYFSKTPYLLVLGWFSMFVRGVGWRDLGLRLPRNWLFLLAAGVVAGIGMEALELFVTQPALVALTGKYPDFSDFNKLAGNLKLLLILIAASWMVAGLGEELVWRGYILNRAADFFGRTSAGWIVSIAAMSVVFGLAHLYQGITGITENAIAGAILALLYLAGGRNLIVPIIAHGMTDTIDFLLIFSRHYPGM